jgi:undecaprenyl-diphosphatase
LAVASQSDADSAFIARHGGKSILIARFTPGVRAVVPLAAGILGMPAFCFYGVNALSAVIRGPSHVGIGVAIGMSLVSFETTRSQLVAVVGAVFAVIALFLWAVPRLVRRYVPPRTRTEPHEQIGK